ncbi:amidohydrolase [Parahalioglobus pacificus]|uniref:Omega-amidase YafV n=1 Tax=Parahalioglobus pacificus TaxID=930806 RepID=A0A918XIU4_9GAMM|nr:amidohydrolase [Halioglobus pacificus]NQY03154.1 amidohydrolase [Halieaceae bacterium]GHD32719.1 nitrilase family protein [Halioglobus pacificus]
MRNLTVAFAQTELQWEQPADNRQQFEQLLIPVASDCDLLVLPEMFTTGFSMNALANAETPGGPTERWMQKLAADNDCAVAGSIAVTVGSDDEPAVYNRLLFVTPEETAVYDKRHLFRMAGEHKRYAPGIERKVVHWRDWRIKLEVCYDLRFPVFSRNRDDYDLLVNVANWPAPRATHWRCLLQARAIENQACVVGVNRIGEDANGLSYQGDSLVFNGRGQALVDAQDKAGVFSTTLDAQALLAYRENFPCHQDADAFSLDLA